MNRFAICLVGLSSLAMAHGTLAQAVAGSSFHSHEAHSEGKVVAWVLSIERDPPLTLGKWRAAVETQPRLRYEAVDSHATNPRTGEVITIQAAAGDVAMELDGRWISVFRWRNGRVMFKASIEDTKDPVSIAAFALAERLGATVRGEEGETYRRPG